MSGSQEALAESDLQAQATAVYQAWAARHSQESQKIGVDIQVLDYDPLAYPEQLIDNSLVPLELPPDISGDVLFPVLTQQLEVALGSAEKAAVLVRDFQDVHTSEQNTTPLLDTIDMVLKCGKNVGILCAHAVIMDAPVALIAISAARGDLSMLNKNVLVLNKAMAFEGVYGIPISHVTRGYTNSIYFSPRTATADHLQIPRRVSRRINERGRAELEKFTTNGGALVATALHGTGMKFNYQGEPGAETLESSVIPRVNYAAASMIESFDYTLGFALWKDPATGEFSWKIGPLELAPTQPENLSQTERIRANSRMADAQQRKLARQVEELSGRPVHYESLESEIGARAMAATE